MDSIKSKSLIFHPAFSNAIFEAGIGPDPIKAGSTPHVAHDTILARGFNPLFSDSSLLINCTAAEPSFIPDELPAVTVPFSLNAALSFDKFSIVTPDLGCSSSNDLSIISCLNLLFFIASCAFD